VYFLGQAQLQDGGTPEPPPSGGLKAVHALAPLVSATDRNGVVVMILIVLGQQLYMFKFMRAFL
jgi:hypothetical protein